MALHKVLGRVRQLLAEGGAVLVADERVAESFIAPGDFAERFMYAWSVLHCLPATRAEEPSVEAGAVLRPSTLDAYAQAAGYRGAEVLPVENDFWRLYLLRP